MIRENKAASRFIGAGSRYEEEDEELEYNDLEYNEEEEYGEESDRGGVLRKILGGIAAVLRWLFDGIFKDGVTGTCGYLFVSGWLYYMSCLTWRAKQLVEFAVTVGTIRISFSYSDFKNLYFALFLAVVTGNVLLRRGQRTVYDCLLPVLVPISSYYILKASAAADSLLCPAAVLAVMGMYGAFMVWSAAGKIRAEQHRRKPGRGTWYWIRRALAKTAQAGLLAFVLAGAISFAMVGGKKTPYEVNKAGEYGLWEANRELLAALQEEKWEMYSNEERCELLGMLAQLEMLWLIGEKDPGLNVVAVQMEDANTQGSYDRVSNEIRVNRDILKERDTVLLTLLHESYHRYQYAVVENVKFDGLNSGYRIVRELEEWQNNFAEYKDGSGDFEEYYEQAIEESARAYSEEWVYEYIWYIEQLD